MLPVIAGIAGIAGLTAIGNAYDEYIQKPIDEYYERKDKERMEYLKEEMRQESITRKKVMHEKHDEIRNKFGLEKKDNHQIKCINI
jgi:hypothetical protein